MASDEFYNEVFEELYREATPGMWEIEEAVYPEEAKIPYLHYLDGDEMMSIVDDYCEEFDVPRSERKQVNFNIVLGKAPSTSLTNVDSYRTGHGLEPASKFLDGKNGECSK